jgi:hypothetical protein
VILIECSAAAGDSGSKETMHYWHCFIGSMESCTIGVYYKRLQGARTASSYPLTFAESVESTAFRMPFITPSL